MVMKIILVVLECSWWSAVCADQNTEVEVRGSKEATVQPAGRELARAAISPSICYGQTPQLGKVQRLTLTGSANRFSDSFPAGDAVMRDAVMR